MKRSSVRVSKACGVWNVVFLLVGAVSLLLGQYMTDIVNLTHGGAMSLLLAKVYYLGVFGILFTVCEAALAFNLARHLKKYGDSVYWLLYVWIVVRVGLFALGNISSFDPTLNIVRQVAGVAYNLVMLAVGIVFCVRYRGWLRWLGILPLVLFSLGIVSGLVNFVFGDAAEWMMAKTAVFLIVLATLFVLQRTMVARR
ncbi:hypothetical protein [Prevotella sp. KH2C16]|uniref:hypothetical protein n=1 Tax=Prevotella sp. KH2C16 TaxID=1855325 RepID=UPI0008EAE4BD|nr:hypothetical protein [Prevotella sp. KH2C16]SFG43945.1 hypothetical protein SAMN05216383_11432 [Prevotella sp. KH2C16]